MINKILFIALILIVSSCQSQIDNEQTSPNYIAIDMKGKYVNELSLEEEKLYNEARNRFDKIVKYNNGQYYLADKNFNDLNISPELYEHFKGIMDYTNSIIKDENMESNAYIPTDSSARTKSRSEFEGQPNSDGIVQSSWYGFEVYLSNSSIGKIAAGASLASVITGFIPHPIAQAISKACGLTGALAAVGSAYYPNGIIISFSYAPVPGGCIPYNIRTQ